MDHRKPSATVTVRNRKGLHARASAKFVKCAEEFNAIVSVTRDGHTVGGTSIMGLMMLAAGPGAQLHLKAEGPEAPEAIDALVALVGREHRLGRPNGVGNRKQAAGYDDVKHGRATLDFRESGKPLSPDNEAGSGRPSGRPPFAAAYAKRAAEGQDIVGVLPAFRTNRFNGCRAVRVVCRAAALSGGREDRRRSPDGDRDPL